MQGDFSRDSFDPRRIFSRVLCQQGRVALDADWNEMQAIQLRLLRTLAADLIGPHGGRGFAVESVTDSDFSLGSGHYYVDGWLCENPVPVWHTGGAERKPQPFWPSEPADALQKTRYLVYLDVWERHLAWPETDGADEIARRSPAALREVALDGLDTASRAQVIWQLRVLDKLVDENGNETELPNLSTEAQWRQWMSTNWPKLLEQWQPGARGRLIAQTDAPGSAEALAPCAVSPEARYRGVENQLYRVEIHRGGVAGPGGASFKWSRENASVLLPLASVNGSELRLSAWWRDARFGLVEGDWVEVFDDADSLKRRPRPLCRVKAVDRDTMSLVLDTPPELASANPQRHPVLRRWDQRLDKTATADGITIDEAATASYALEDGIRVRFSAGMTNQRNHYRSGDYWLIPARTAIADIVWPRSGDPNGVLTPEALPPHGVEHHYAPLAVVEIGSGKPPTPLSREIGQVAKPA